MNAPNSDMDVRATEVTELLAGNVCRYRFPLDIRGNTLVSSGIDMGPARYMGCPAVCNNVTGTNNAAKEIVLPRSLVAMFLPIYVRIVSGRGRAGHAT